MTIVNAEPQTQQRKPLSGIGSLLLATYGQRDLRPSILCATGDCGVRRYGIRCPHACGLYARDVDPRGSEAFGQNARAILCKLLQRAFVAYVIGECLD